MKRVRALFLSDIHLGTRACQADRLLAFLKEYESEYIYLVGDIIDLWAMSRSIYWPSAHNTVVQKLLRKARHHTRVIFIGMSFGAVDIASEYVHVTATGKRLLLVHGDDYDQVTTCHRWLSVLGDVSYTMLVHINRALSWTRRKLGVSGHWSLADYAKRNVLKAVAYIGDFERAAAHTAIQRGMDGIICGHIHTPVIRDIDGVRYINCGDWVDSCTAIVEQLDGHIDLVRTTPELRLVDPVASQSERAAAAPRAADGRHG